MAVAEAVQIQANPGTFSPSFQWAGAVVALSSFPALFAVVIRWHLSRPTENDAQIGATTSLPNLLLQQSFKFSASHSSHTGRSRDQLQSGIPSASPAPKTTKTLSSLLLHRFVQATTHRDEYNLINTQHQPSTHQSQWHWVGLSSASAKLAFASSNSAVQQSSSASTHTSSPSCLDMT